MFPYPSQPKSGGFPLMVVGVFYRPANIVVIRKSWFDYSSSFLDEKWIGLWGAMMCWWVSWRSFFTGFLTDALFWSFFWGESMVHGSCWRSLKKKGSKTTTTVYSRPDRYWFMSVCSCIYIMMIYIYIYIFFKYTYRTTQHFDNGYQRTFLIQARQVEPEKFVTSTTESLQLGRLSWNLQITHLDRRMIFQTSREFCSSR